MSDYTDELLNFGEEVTDFAFLTELKKRVSSLLSGNLSSLSSSSSSFSSTLPLSPHRFPGSQPVSFRKEHIELLKKEDYFVCEKSDGVRYLLYYTVPYGECVAFLMDRNMKVRSLPSLYLPTKDGTSVHQDTIVDGELLIEENPKTGQKITKFLAFDCLLVDGKSLLPAPLPQRLKHLQNDIIAPLRHLLSSTTSTTIQQQPFQLSMKQMWKSYSIGVLLDEVIPNQHHQNDGLIFTPVHLPYIVGTCQSLLKWKPSELNSVDFLLDKQGSSNELLVSTNPSTHVPFTFYSEEHSEDLKDIPTNSIIECKFYMNEWKFLRVRKDKLAANNKEVVLKIIESIKDNLSSSDLKEAIPEIKKCWLERA